MNGKNVKEVTLYPRPGVYLELTLVDGTKLEVSNDDIMDAVDTILSNE